MLRRPITLIIALTGLVLVAVYNFVHFKTRGRVATDLAAETLDEETSLPQTDLNGLLDQLHELQTRTVSTSSKPELAGGREMNLFLYPSEREKGQPIDEVMQIRAKERALKESRGSRSDVVSEETPSTALNPEAALEALELRGVIYRPGRSLAVLERTRVREGDTILGGRVAVEKIEPDRVHLRVGDQTMVKTLKPFEVILPKEGEKEQKPASGAGRAELPKRIHQSSETKTLSGTQESQTSSNKDSNHQK